LSIAANPDGVLDPHYYSTKEFDYIPVARFFVELNEVLANQSISGGDTDRLVAQCIIGECYLSVTLKLLETEYYIKSSTFEISGEGPFNHAKGYVAIPFNPSFAAGITEAQTAHWTAKEFHQMSHPPRGGEGYQWDPIVNAVAGAPPDGYEYVVPATLAATIGWILATQVAVQTMVTNLGLPIWLPPEWRTPPVSPGPISPVPQSYVQ
jgi:hypothetical protein